MRQTLLILLVLLKLQNTAQKYNFVNWTVEDGLVQSQASIICQDKFRQLWIGTEGGLSCFDGKKFRSYTVQDGLPANHISSILCARDSTLWVGTNKGLVSYKGRNFQPQKITRKNTDHVRTILETQEGLLYFLNNFRLYARSGGTFTGLCVSGDSSEMISSITAAHKNTVIAAVYGKGIYAGGKNNWTLIAKPVGELADRVVYRTFITSNGDTLLSFNHGLYVIRKKQVLPFTVKGHKPFERLVLCFAEDKQQHLWMGTENGVYKIAGDESEFFSGKSGFTDNSVNHIFLDAEHNLWFATNADGIYKFRENTFTYYDRSSGLTNPIVMGIAQTNDSIIYLGGFGGGLYFTDGKSTLQEAEKASSLSNAKINCLYAGSNNLLWIGTLNQGIYSYSKQSGTKRITATDRKMVPTGATVFYEDAGENLLIGGNQGLFVKHLNGSITHVPLPGTLVTAIIKFDHRHTLVGTSKGLFLLNDDHVPVPFYGPELGQLSVMCLSKNKDHLWIGTSDIGIYLIQLQKKKIVNYNTADGLPSNFIYSIDATEPSRLWAGTGFGISRLDLSKEGKIASIKNFGRSDGLLGMECNHNSLLRAADASLWFGTTKGLFRFDPHSSVNDKTAPLVLLRSVKLFSSEITDTTLFASADPFFEIPRGLELESHQNHLSFELGALYFTNPDDVLYRYKLEGIDKGFTTSNNPFIMYPGLPPGKYTLLVKGQTKSGIGSVNEISFTFEIKKAFYQTPLFQVMMIVLLIGSGAFTAYLITRARQKRKQHEKELHERIREEEFTKLRQRTAEDFHDEMGNSLTRISVLTDVLKRKLNGTEKEVSHIVEQIKNNTTALYNGSRDIIWSLSSKNDALYEIAEHIKDIGSEVFQDTQVEFRYSHNIDASCKLKLKLDYSRNLTMIFKEAYSNILKHANASIAEVDIELQNNHTLLIKLRDNGSGFEITVQGTKGNGLRNMQNRVKRMQGLFRVHSSTKSGTEINIFLDNIFVNDHGKKAAHKSADH